MKGKKPSNAFANLVVDDDDDDDESNDSENEEKVLVEKVLIEKAIILDNTSANERLWILLHEATQELNLISLSSKKPSLISATIHGTKIEVEISLFIQFLVNHDIAIEAFKFAKVEEFWLSLMKQKSEFYENFVFLLKIKSFQNYLSEKIVPDIPVKSWDLLLHCYDTEQSNVYSFFLQSICQVLSNTRNGKFTPPYLFGSSTNDNKSTNFFNEIWYHLVEGIALSKFDIRVFHSLFIWEFCFSPLKLNYQQLYAGFQSHLISEPDKPCIALLRIWISLTSSDDNLCSLTASNGNLELFVENQCFSFPISLIELNHHYQDYEIILEGVRFNQTSFLDAVLDVLSSFPRSEKIEEVSCELWNRFAEFKNYPQSNLSSWKSIIESKDFTSDNKKMFLQVLNNNKCFCESPQTITISMVTYKSFGSETRNEIDLKIGNKKIQSCLNMNIFFLLLRQLRCIPNLKFQWETEFPLGVFTDSLKFHPTCTSTSLSFDVSWKSASSWNPSDLTIMNSIFNSWKKDLNSDEYDVVYFEGFKLFYLLNNWESLSKHSPKTFRVSSNDHYKLHLRFGKLSFYLLLGPFFHILHILNIQQQKVGAFEDSKIYCVAKKLYSEICNDCMKQFHQDRCILFALYFALREPTNQGHLEYSFKLIKEYCTRFYVDSSSINGKFTCIALRRFFHCLVPFDEMIRFCCSGVGNYNSGIDFIKSILIPVFNGLFLSSKGKPTLMRKVSALPDEIRDMVFTFIPNTLLSYCKDILLFFRKLQDHSSFSKISSEIFIPYELICRALSKLEFSNKDIYYQCLKTFCVLIEDKDKGAEHSHQRFFPQELIPLIETINIDCNYQTSTLKNSKIITVFGNLQLLKKYYKSNSYYEKVKKDLETEKQILDTVNDRSTVSYQKTIKNFQERQHLANVINLETIEKQREQIIQILKATDKDLAKLKAICSPLPGGDGYVTYVLAHSQTCIHDSNVHYAKRFSFFHILEAFLILYDLKVMETKDVFLALIQLLILRKGINENPILYNTVIDYLPSRYFVDSEENRSLFKTFLQLYITLDRIETVEWSLSMNDMKSYSKLPDSHYSAYYYL
jgi:hypothetical protein